MIKRVSSLPRWVLLMLALLMLALVLGGGYVFVRFWGVSQSNSSAPIRRWFDDPAARPGLMTVRDRVACPGAPFILPSNGFIGLLWGDPIGPYTVLNPHSGIDIFGDGTPGEVPIYAAYAGYLTRLPDWFSTVIIRHDDPLQPGRTIWTYYTHMGSRDGAESYVAAAFPPGTDEVWVEQGTLLGHQGDYAGVGRPPVGLHVHFSVVLSGADGLFTNEARISNTLDPSPYLGMEVSSAQQPPRPINCHPGE